MRKYVFVGIIMIFIASLITFYGCKKNCLIKLRGSWKMISWGNMCDDMVINFIDDEKVLMIENNVTDTVEYFLETGLSKTYITFSPYVGCQTVFTGRWIIMDLKKDCCFAIIFQEGTGQTSREFEKAE